MSAAFFSRNDKVLDSIAFFQLARQTFERVTARAGSAINRFYRIAGHNVRLDFADSALVRLLTPALAHLKTQSFAKSELTIYIWDSASLGFEDAPVPPWSSDDYTARGEVRDRDDAQVATAFHSNTLSMMDKKLNLGMYWVRDARQLTYTESGAPLLRIFHWWMRLQGKQLVHAGAVGNSEAGALVVGKGGSGKSTTCLLCLDSDLSYVGDDYCLVSTGDSPRAYSLYSSGKVNAADIGRFPSLRIALSNTDRLAEEKALYFFNDHFSKKLATGFPLRAVLLPRVTRRPETAFREISASASLLALAPSTIFQLPGAGPDALRTLGDLVRKTRSYRLEVGTTLAEIPGAISKLLSEL